MPDQGCGLDSAGQLAHLELAPALLLGQVTPQPYGRNMETCG